MLDDLARDRLMSEMWQELALGRSPMGTAEERQEAAKYVLSDAASTALRELAEIAHLAWQKLQNNELRAAVTLLHHWRTEDRSKGEKLSVKIAPIGLFTQACVSGSTNEQLYAIMKLNELLSPLREPSAATSK